MTVVATHDIYQGDPYVFWTKSFVIFDRSFVIFDRADPVRKARLCFLFIMDLVENGRVLLRIREFDWLCHRFIFADRTRSRTGCHN